MSFNACGEGNGKSSKSQTNSTNKHQKKNAVILIKSCDVSSDITDYTKLESGNVIKKDIENTVIKVYHNTSNKKWVCTKEGKASLVRN